MNFLSKIMQYIKPLTAILALTAVMSGVPVYAQTLEYEYLMHLSLGVGEGMSAGEITVGPITGGSFSGPGLEGIVLPGGADWSRRSEGHNNLDVRITLQTEDDEILYLNYHGILAGNPFAEEGADYWTVAISIGTSSEQLDELNHIVAIGKGQFIDGQVVYDIYKIL